MIINSQKVEFAFGFGRLKSAVTGSVQVQWNPKGLIRHMTRESDKLRRVTSTSQRKRSLLRKEQKIGIWNDQAPGTTMKLCTWPGARRFLYMDLTLFLLF